MSTHPLFVLGGLGFAVALSEILVRRTPLRHLGSSLLVIVLMAVFANVGLVPTYSDEVSVYVGIFDFVAPLAIFLLLLQVHLRQILRAGGMMLGLFLLGAVGTVAGVLTGLFLVGGVDAFGEDFAALGGMFVGTYIGGSINFNAVALEYDVMKNAGLYAGAAAVDSAMTTIWMAATVILPRILPRGTRPGEPSKPRSPSGKTSDLGEEADRESVTPLDFAILLGLGGLTVWGSEVLSSWAEARFGFAVPSILLLTTIGLLLAQIPVVQRLRGAGVCGWFAILLFLGVIGALCDVSALASLGRLGVSLSLFVVIVVSIHGVIVFGVGALARIDPFLSAVASQANIGGGTSALALARSLDRGDLVVPAILVGALGNAIGTYLGFFTVAWLS